MILDSEAFYTLLCSRIKLPCDLLTVDYFYYVTYKVTANDFSNTHAVLTSKECFTGIDLIATLP